MGENFRVLGVGMEGNPFDLLAGSVTFDSFGKGRQATTLVEPNASGDIPIVRTTTRYPGPAKLFRPVHRQLADQVQTAASLSEGFNNALIEIYTNDYSKMGAHSDQAIDLLQGSSIAIFSCYENPELLYHSRELIIESKGQDKKRRHLQLAHNSVVVFSLSTNRKNRHKIVLPNARNAPKNNWLGVTFRTSSTFVDYADTTPQFTDGSSLRLANENEAQKFFRLRGRENKDENFTYPRLPFTVSESDLIPPV